VDGNESGGDDAPVSEREPGRASNSGRSSPLLALGSAAVIAVYAAGYLRTEAAAQAYTEESERRPPPRVTEPSPAAAPAVVTPDSAPAVVTVRVNVDSVRAAVRSEKADSPAKSSAVAVAKPTTGDSSSAAAVAAPVPAAPKAPTDSTRAASSDSAQTPEKPRGALKDGVYFGWGTSRHGDVQMGVEVKEGRIKSAFISECLTQYSCSLIAHLPPQVVSRQSADVDYVSGATQSANALYRGVVAALVQAK
jgi:uncharacterized protein with FMN-binding domain